jgi:hypothetical protein
MRRRSFAILPLLALAATAACADEAAMRSDACRHALQALQAREAALARPQPTAPASAPPQPTAAASAPPDAKPRLVGDRTWQTLRARAAQACLGGAPDAPRPLPRSGLPPIAVPPVAAEPTPLRLPSARPAPAIEPRRPTPMVNSCDAGGCWMSDGSRMPQVGKNPLVDPKVRCTVQGAFVLCQ